MGYPAPAFHLMQPTPGPPFGTPPARSVWKMFFLQRSPLQVALSSDISTTLPSTVLSLTVLGEAIDVTKMPVLTLPLTVLPRAVLPGDSNSIPLKLLLRTLFAIRFPVPLKMATPPCS